MSAPFGGPPPRFAPADGDGHYRRQLAEMERRFSSTQSQIDGWRRIALMLGGIATITAGGSVYLAASRQAEVHVVEIDATTGEPLEHRLLAEPVRVDDAIIAHTLARWIQMTRGRSIDPVVLRQAWDDAYRFVPMSARPAIDAYAREIDAFNPKTLGKDAVSVAVASVTRQSEDGFQVRWTETRFQDGQAHHRQSWTANLAIAFVAPTEPRQIQVNPLGLMITAIHLQPDYREPAPRS